MIKPAHEALIRQAAQGEVLHNDDTGMRVLEMEREPSDERTGVFTSGTAIFTGGVVTFAPWQTRSVFLFYEEALRSSRRGRTARQIQGLNLVRSPVNIEVRYTLLPRLNRFRHDIFLGKMVSLN